MGFGSIFGHEKQKKVLLSLLDRERLPHAFLFSGQNGIGKKMLAIEFIKHIFCETGEACGMCRSCVKVAHGNHPDLFVLDVGKMADTGSARADDEFDQEPSSGKRKKSIGVHYIRGSQEKKIRGINQEVNEYPYEGDKRAILIDDAETMTREAANALLKTLEEPPPYNIFFLITSSERDIPVTIRSRCARIAFSPLGEEHLDRYFREVLGLEEKKARLLSRISYGSIGSGQFWMEENHLLLRRKLAELITGKSRSFVNTTLLSEHVTRTDDALSMYLAFLLSLLKDMCVVREYGDTSMAVNRDVREFLDGKIVDARWLDRAIEKVQETMTIMRYNVNRWLLFENLLLQITR
jgi:DNA polymerase-3 subunit delta'